MELGGINTHHDTVTRMQSPGRQLAGLSMLVLLALASSPGTPLHKTGPDSVAHQATDLAGEPHPTRRTLAVSSEGLSMVGAPIWHNAGFKGGGTRVAIVDLGFDGWDTLLDGELPTDIETISFDTDEVLDTGTDHGTQMAEIVHDMAPEAKLVLVTFADAYMAEMVDWLVATEVDVVSMSLEWVEGPLDGTHFSTEHIQRGIDAGITWVVAAGNSAERHHVGTTVDNDYDGWVEMDGTFIEFNQFRLAGEVSADLLLTWDNETTDLDLCVFDMELGLPNNDAPTQIKCSELRQGGGEPAIETLTLLNGSSDSRLYGYSIKLVSGGEAVYDTRIWGSSNLEFSNPAASIGVPANMTDVLTVGAVAWDTGILEPYSGWGPNQEGVLKPEVVAPAQISTSRWAGASNTGTSYSAPHVAGAAALMIGAMPGLNPASVKERLRNRGSQADSPDHRQGWGIMSLGVVPSSIVAIRGHWAETSIDWAFDSGITAGCPSGEVATGYTCPELAVTRDEMAKFMWRSKDQPTPSTTASFEDVGANASYRTAVDWLAEEAITLGCTTTSFCPDGTVTRAEMAAFLWRLEGSPEVPNSANFGDVPDSSFYSDATSWLLDTGITTGCTPSAYCPQGTVTRAEMFTFLHRLESMG